MAGRMDTLLIMTTDPLAAALRRLENDHAPAALQATFTDQLRRVMAGETGLIEESDIEPVTDLPALETLAGYAAAGGEALATVAAIKLNGGLGTGMGLDKAKSLLPVKPGLNFLDILTRQILHLRRQHGIALPLVLMNSYSTEVDSLSALAECNELMDGQSGLPLSFLQNRVPKLRADTLEPVQWPDDHALEWCPPGHGDVYTALETTGLLDLLLKAGLRYAFISNADNLGATLDPVLLGYLAKRQLPFLMEVTARTEADRKGGHLACRPRGGFVLRESAQCPPADTTAFQDIGRHRFFNTNNLWIDLHALRTYMDRTGQPPALPVMVNRKTVDPRNPASTPVLQLETAMGAALGVFEGAEAVCVPRTRFAPVKTTDDLLALWSDAYVLDEQSHLRLDPRRQLVPPVVKLDSRYYKMWPDFEKRFPHGAPSLVNCRSLSVEGDVVFAAGIALQGDVRIQNKQARTVTLQPAHASGSHIQL